MIECICVDGKDRPEEIPIHNWPVEKQKYHITHIFYHPMQGIQGCELKELKLGEESYPYGSYRLNRFAFTKENLEKLIQMMKDCSELNDVDINKLLRKSEVEILETEECLK